MNITGIHLNYMLYGREMSEFRAPARIHSTTDCDVINVHSRDNIR